MSEFSHLDERGQARMVDVSEKEMTLREARATGRILLGKEIFYRLQDDDLPKGDVLATARIAGIMAMKETSRLIPMCHPLALTAAEVHFSYDEEDYALVVETVARLRGKTGVEMEALTGASVALLTVYDMVKALSKSMRIEGVCLLEKSGGKSGHYLRKDPS